MAHNISGLSNVIKERNAELLTKIYSSGAGLASGHVRFIPNIKYKERMHFYTPNLVWATGDCVSGDTGGGTSFTEKELEVHPFNYDSRSCISEFEKKWYGQLLPEGSYYTDEQYIQPVADGITAAAKTDYNRAIWRGGYNGYSAALPTVDGFLKKLTSTYNGTCFSASNYVGYSFSAGSAIAIVDDLIANQPEELDGIEMVFSMGRSSFHIMKKALADANYGDAAVMKDDITGAVEFNHPLHDNVKFQLENGLMSEKAFIVTFRENLLGLGDGSNDDEVRVIYDEVNDKVIERIKIKAGAQIAFPEYVGIHTWA